LNAFTGKLHNGEPRYDFQTIGGHLLILEMTLDDPARIYLVHLMLTRAVGKKMGEDRDDCLSKQENSQ